MKVSEAIKLLESKVVKSEENLKHFPKESQGYAANEARIIAYNIAINKLEQIDEPQAEKQEVSQEFADWVEKAKTVKDGLDYKNWCVKEIATIGWGNWLHDPERILDGKVIYDEWVNAVADNKEKHIKAIYDGYTVKPTQWVVKRLDCGANDMRLSYFLHGTVDPVWALNGNPMVFTDRAKAEAVALLVEGTVEEV